MKARLLAFPLALAFSPSVFAADFIWKGTTNSTWGTGTNWLGGTAPTYGATLTADRLVIGNAAASGAVYDPGAGVTTTFGSGRGIIIGSTTNGAANLTVTSGTLKINGASGAGNEPIMANGVSASLLINGGNLDLTGHPLAFRFFGSGSAGLTSNLTVSSGSFSSNGFDLHTGGTAGAGTINLDGGSIAVTGFTRTATIGSTILNLNGGTLRIRSADNASFLNALTGLQTIVKTGGAVIDSNNLNLTIAEVLEHDTTLGAGLDGGLTKNGAGTLTLSGASTYNGATSISSGTLSAANIVVSGGSSNLGNATSAVTLGSAGSQGTLSYTGNSATYTRGFTIGGAGGGRLDVTTAGQTLSVDTGAITGSGLFTVGGAGRTTINAAITHTGGLTKAASSGTLTLSNSSNSYNGVTDITGALIVTANNALGSTAGGTTVNTASALGLSGNIDYTALETVSGSGVGTGVVAGITSASRGFIQSVSGNNTFRGDIIVNAGGVSRIGTQNGASLTLTGAITQASGSMYFRPGDTAGDYVTLSNSGNSFGGNSLIYTNASAGNYAGVRLGVDNALPTTLTISGDASTGAGTALDLNGRIQTLNGLTGANNLNIINSNTSTASTLTIGNLVDRSTTGTLIRGGVGLGTINVIKDGAFTQTLSGTHDYTGTTDVNEGKLVINGNISTSSLTTVASGATLGGNASVGALTVAAGGFVTPGNSPGSLIVNGAYIQAGTYTAEIDGLTPGTQHDQISVTGTVDITGGSLTTLFTGTYAPGDMIFLLLNDDSDAITGTYSGFAQGAVVSTYGGFDWQISYLANSGGSPTFTGGNDIALMAVPEPNAAALLGGLGLLALIRRRR